MSCAIARNFYFHRYVQYLCYLIYPYHDRKNLRTNGNLVTSLRAAAAELRSNMYIRGAA